MNYSYELSYILKYLLVNIKQATQSATELPNVYVPECTRYDIED